MDYSDINVLIIDDDATTRRIITRLIKQIGFVKFSEAENGKQAYQMLQEESYDLILSDWDMPVMNGYQLLEKIRADANYKKTPFIMVTANDNKESIIEAVKAKVSQYIVKPFTVTALKEKIGKVLTIGKNGEE
jgi:two-component system chemotaxis response regulator CheY